jgi:hypothetical protein
MVVYSNYEGGGCGCLFSQCECSGHWTRSRKGCIGSLYDMPDSLCSVYNLLSVFSLTHAVWVQSCQDFINLTVSSSLDSVFFNYQGGIEVMTQRSGLILFGSCWLQAETSSGLISVYTSKGLAFTYYHDTHGSDPLSCSLIVHTASRVQFVHFSWGSFVHIPYNLGSVYYVY